MDPISIFWELTGLVGQSGFGSSSTAEQVTAGVDASNLTAIVTGGASGIGEETTRILALRGARVIIAARNIDAANAARGRIIDSNPAALVDVLKLDLASLKSVRSFAENFLAMDLPLNLLVNNAGVMYCPFQLSEDGIELQFATNHLGHFLLTNLLLEKMKATERETGVQGRIVNLSSIAHTAYSYPGGIRFDAINDESSYYDKAAYGQSKLANILHANELARRLQEEGSKITVNSVHPGLIVTNLWRHSFFGMSLLRLFTFPIWKNVQQGAATTCYAALHPAVGGVTGKYFQDCNERPPSAYARDDGLAKKLWDFSEKLVSSSQ